jgi:hypothetical protein
VVGVPSACGGAHAVRSNLSTERRQPDGFAIRRTPLMTNAIAHMTPEDLVQALKSQFSDAAESDCLSNFNSPPG